MADLTSLRNIGPALAATLEAVGITTAEELRTLGADAAYEKVLRGGTRPHFISYYVLHMAVQGRPWNDCRGDEKTALRKRFDTLKSAAAKSDESELERILDRIGVIARKNEK